MRRKYGQTMGDRLFDASPQRRVEIDRFQGAEQKGVMGDQQVDFCSAGRLNNFRQRVEGGPDATHLPVSGTDL